MKATKPILFILVILFIGCKGDTTKINKTKTSNNLGDISIAEIKEQLGEKYEISVASINANHGRAFQPIAMDTMLPGKFQIDEIKNKKTLQRKIETKPFDRQLVDQYQFESLPSYTHHILNYEIDCNTPKIRIAAKVSDGCSLFMIVEDESTGYMVSLPLFKQVIIKGYSGQVTSEIDGCQIKRVIKETFGVSDSYEVNGKNILPKRETVQHFELESNGHLILKNEQNHLVNMNYFESS